MLVCSIQGDVVARPTRYNNKNVSISLPMRYSPSLDPFSLELAPNPRPPNVRAVARVKFREGFQGAWDTYRHEGMEKESFRNFLFPPPLSILLAARFIKIEGSSSVPLPSRKSAETSPYVSPRFPSFLFSLFFSLTSLITMTLPGYGCGARYSHARNIDIREGNV